MPFDSLVFTGITRELGQTLLGGHVQKIYQPHDLEVHLIIRSQGKNHRLLISADARFGRVCLTSSSPENPPSPPGFCMALRKHLEGAHLVEIVQVDFDRILHLRFQYGDGTTKTLIVEIMGRHSNVILIDAGGVILDALKRIPTRLSRFREVLPGRHYIAPPSGDKADPLAIDPGTLQHPDPDQMSDWLQQSFRGMSGWLVGEITSRAEQSTFVEAWAEIFNSVRTGQLEPTLLLNESRQAEDYFALPSAQFPADRQRQTASMNDAVDQVAESISHAVGVQQARQSLANAISSALKLQELKRQDSLKGLAESDRADEYRIKGELLLTYMSTLKKGERVAELVNYYDPEERPIKITLDPRLSPKENAEAYFRRQRKARESREELQKRIEKLGEQIYDLKVAQLELPEKTEVSQIDELRSRLVEQGLLSRPQAPIEKKKKEAAIPSGIRRVTTPEGWEILVGESAVANDYVTTKMASPSDLWFHARAVAGAHVILRTAGKPVGQIPASAIREAARLAALGSEAKHSALVPVDYTQKRYVRKPRGSAPGNVLYQNEKTLHVELKS